MPTSFGVERQPSLPFLAEGGPAMRPAALTEAVDELAAAEAEDRGAVFTRREVVDFILELVGYVPTEPLAERRLLEPSAGAGDFLLPAVDRLLACWQSSAGSRNPLDLTNAVRAVELHHETYRCTRLGLLDRLAAADIGAADAKTLAGAWLVQDDFLLTEIDGEFDYIVGNPPYLRQERIPSVLLAEYRRRYRTVYDRADLYVPFIERSLGLLSTTGRLGFICADR